MALLAVLAATAAGGSLAADAGAGAAKPVKCVPKGATTIYSTPQVRIFSYVSTGPVEERDLYACLRPKGRSRFLFDGAINEFSSNIRIVGERYVALADFREVPVDGAHETSLLVVDLTTGKRSSVDMYDPPSEADFQLLADGSMVYISRDYDDTTGELSTKTGSLVRVPFQGTAQQLDTGSIVDLAVSAHTVYWTKDGVATSKTF